MSCQLNGVTLRQVSNTKYLGVFAPNKHIKKTVNKATDLLGILQRQVRYSTPKTNSHSTKPLFVPT